MAGSREGLSEEGLLEVDLEAEQKLDCRNSTLPVGGRWLGKPKGTLGAEQGLCG